jgi:serine/threonine protein kinase/soluble lytic murein transglycosylase-like protein
MTPERWREIEAVLQGALDRPPLERASFLEDACAGDEELKEETNSLITAYEAADDFIEQPAIVHDARVLIGGEVDRSIGQEIGPYRIIERLGAGGMGEVYLAQDLRLSRLVALKVLPTYFASDEVRLRRFQSEARAASALNDPNILTIHEVGESDGVFFIVTEFIDGQTIRALIRKQTLSLEEVLDSAEQVASALSTAHAAGIVHRDIKPENIMRRTDGLVKILDFGIAKLMEPESPDSLPETTLHRTHTEAGMVIGTVNYMSPEQARALPVDERTDIWSLGVVLYEMLAHRLPFSGPTQMDTMVAILDREPAPLSEVAPELLSQPLLQQIVSKCLCKEITDRYRTCRELLVDLGSAREQLSLRSSQASLAIPGLTRKNRPQDVHAHTKALAPYSRRYVWPVLGIVALLIAATFVTLLYRRSVALRPTVIAPATEATNGPGKLYSQMSEAERLEFVDTQAHRVSTMIGDRPAKLNQDAVRIIKAYVDRYVSDGSSANPGSESISEPFARAQPYVPLIAHSFAARKVPVIIGIYLPLIESRYRNCYESSLGAKGLFQFLPQTAENYGVSRQEMCDVEKMTPAAAHYIADRMAELGEDSESVTLVLLSYNRGAEWVRDTLRELRSTENYERNFWTLFANRKALDETFRHENAGYVPSFFAAAIIGENPQTFGLEMPPLSTLAGANVSVTPN